MTPEERQRRFEEINRELAEIVKHKVVPLLTEREGELLEELDRIEYEEGMEHYGWSDTGGKRPQQQSGGDSQGSSP